MTEQEVAKQGAVLLKKIIRSIDKRIEYEIVNSTHEGIFSLRLLIRGRTGVTSLKTSDLRLALLDDSKKNTIRRKLKNTRDHLLSTYVDDVMGNKVTRMLTQASRQQGDSKATFFYMRPRGRR